MTFGFIFRTVAALTLVLAGPAQSACKFESFKTNGQVTKGGSPVSGVTVQGEWEERGNLMTATARTDAEGRYELSIRFDTYSGRSILAKEKCEAKLKNAQIVAQTGSVKLTREVSFKNGAATANFDFDRND